MESIELELREFDKAGNLAARYVQLKDTDGEHRVGIIVSAATSQTPDAHNTGLWQEHAVVEDGTGRLPARRLSPQRDGRLCRVWSVLYGCA